MIMKLDQNRLVLGGLILGIVLLLAIVILIFVQPQPVGNSFAKTFSKDVHEGLLEAKQTTSELVDTLKQTDPPQGQEEEYTQLYALAVSNKDEIEWVLKNETVVFEELQATENNLRAAELLQREIGFFVLTTHLGTLQEGIVNTLSDETLDEQETLDFAEQEKNNILAKSFVSPQSASSLAGETGLTERQIKEGSKQVLAEYLEFKKQRFDTETQTEFKLVEAHKLLAWYFLLQAIPEQ